MILVLKKALSLKRKKLVTDLIESSNKMFFGLKAKGLVSQKELQYFPYEFKKSANLGKLYLLHKVHEKLSAIPRRPSPKR